MVIRGRDYTFIGSLYVRVGEIRRWSSRLKKSSTCIQLAKTDGSWSWYTFENHLLLGTFQRFNLFLAIGRGTYKIRLIFCSNQKKKKITIICGQTNEDLEYCSMMNHFIEGNLHDAVWSDFRNGFHCILVAIHTYISKPVRCIQVIVKSMTTSKLCRTTRS